MIPGAKSVEQALDNIAAADKQLPAECVQAIVEGFVIDEYSLDFRVGGRERTLFRFGGGEQVSNETIFLDILPDQRIIFTFTMKIADRLISISLATVEFRRVSQGTQLIYTEQGAFFDVTDKMTNRKHGTAELFDRKFFRKNLKLGEGGETSADNELLEATFKRTGVSIMGKNMFALGEQMWPEEAPFHTPVFVLTQQVRSPWERPGGTTFYFVNHGIESALRQAHDVVGGRDIRIAGSANVIQQYLNAGLVEELHIGLAPVFFGEGLPLFAAIDRTKVKLEIIEAINSPLVAHLRYAVTK